MIEELRPPRSSDESGDSRTEAGTEREEKTQTQSIFELLKKDGPLTRREIQEKMQNLRGRTSLEVEIQREKKKGRIFGDAALPENGRLVYVFYINNSQLYQSPRATELWIPLFERNEHIQGLVREAVKGLGERDDITLELIASRVGKPLADIEKETPAELRRLGYYSHDGLVYSNVRGTAT